MNQDEAWNSYFYPNTNVLKNKKGIMDKDELKEVEAEVSFEKLVELYEKPIDGEFNKQHLCDIHRYLFDTIYDWAGEYRIVLMQKNNSYFAEAAEIDERLIRTCKEMNEEFADISTKEKLSSLVAKYYVRLLFIHPFREGNGRSIREFMREFVHEKTKNLACGAYEIDWKKINANKVNELLPFGYAFFGGIEYEFFNGLVPVEKLGLEL